tara:strand:+ start:103 stop:546 length:444 start_codon:yes stop_codon:yes gene_type:complete
MGKKKIRNFSIIENRNSRNITYGKRHKGLIKKAMELSMLCGQEVFVSIYDKTKGKLVVYSSSEEVTIKEVKNTVLKHGRITDPLFEHYIDEDYNLFSEENIAHVNKLDSVIGSRRFASGNSDIFETSKKEDESKESFIRTFELISDA